MTNYRIEVQLNPDEHVLRARADIKFVPQDATRSIVFELNGSLHVDSVEKDDKALTGPEGSYLMYASRWFPFHDYAADRATVVSDYDRYRDN